ncbi:hypothetical protein Tco_1205437 [Tanacetum coccineum]
MQHVNTKILKENQNLRNELKELTSITKTWLNSSNKVNQYIGEEIPTQKKKMMGIDQLTEDTSSSGPKDPVFVKSSADNSYVSITGSNKPKLSEAEDSTLPNHDTGKVPSNESQRNTTDHLVVVFDSSATDYDSANESSVCSTPLPLLEKLTSAKPPLLRIKKGSPASKAFTAPAGKLKNVKIEDDPPLAIVMKELNKLKLQLSKKKSSHSKNHQSQQRTDHRTCDHAEFMSSIKTSQYHTGQGESSLRSRPFRPVICFPSCIHYGYNDHQSDDGVYYPICDLCGSYDHDTHNHNMIISLRRGIKPRNPQHKGEAKKAGGNKTVSSNVQRSKTPTQRLLAQIWEVPRPKGMYGDNSTYTTKGHGYVKLWYSFHKRST